MTNDSIKNLAASVKDRVNRYAKEHRLNAEEAQQYYALSQVLYRISKSKYRDKFILKGGLMLSVFDGPLTRATRDIDMLAYVENSPENLKAIFKDCLSLEVPDGISFDAETVKTEEITKEAEYQGVRISFLGKMENTRLNIQIDCGFGDIVHPSPIEIEFPQIINQNQIKLLGYPLESIIAEKYQAIVALSLINSRLKDFYDIWWLAKTKSFNGATLSEAIKKTFEKRATEIPDKMPIALTDTFYNMPTKAAQWRGFLRKMKRDRDENINSFANIFPLLIEFLMPLTQALSKGDSFDKSWSPNGSWK